MKMPSGKKMVVLIVVLLGIQFAFLLNKSTILFSRLDLHLF